MRYLSLFSGIEAASVAWEPLGWEPMAFSEIEPFPCAVLEKRWPNVPNLGDITAIDWDWFREEHGVPDLIVGGSPCFVAGTLVLCESGFKPIEEVAVGDRVVTHKGRLRNVLAIGSKTADTIVLKGQGSVGIECTPSHPFLAKSKNRAWDKAKRRYEHVADVEPSWMPAKDMLGRFWLNVCEVERSEPPMLGGFGKGSRGHGYIDGFRMTGAFFYFVGRWLGDGWANAHKRKGRVDSWSKRVYLCCSKPEADSLESRLADMGLHFGRNDNGSTVRFTCSSTQLYDYMVGNFGVHADGKNVPAWAFGLDGKAKKAILEGYLDADGTKVENGWKSTTVNRRLAIGMKMLAASAGMASSVTYNPGRGTTVIEGRLVNESPTYVSSHFPNPRSAFFSDCGYWGLVRSIGEGRRGVTVYNLEVEEDNSYTVDGIAVHNCQSYSIAGKREGRSGASGLMYEYIRAVRELRPRFFLWENVPGALSVEKGAAFGQLLSEMDDCGYDLAWRVLDSQFCRVPLYSDKGELEGFFGPVAQRRRRLFLVGCSARGGGCASDVLLEPEGMRWDTLSSRKKREALAESAGRGVGENLGGAGSLTGWDVQSKRIFSADSVSPTLNSGTNEGAIAANPDFAKGQGGSLICMSTANTRSNGSNVNLEDVSYTLDGSNCNAVCVETESCLDNAVTLDDGTSWVVRRLTPLECERLMGFPDGYTDIGEWTDANGKTRKSADTPRYKALGNSFAVNVVRWIGERLQAVDERLEKRHGSKERDVP